MNLIIDIGNSKVKYALFNKSELIDIKISDNLTIEHLRDIFAEYHPEKVISCSVRADDKKAADWLTSQAFFLQMNYATRVPVESKYESPETLGLDRLASVVGGNNLYPGQNILCIDIGTCITYDFIDQDGIYFGGGIAPGIDLRFMAMHNFTQKLPLVNFKDTESYVELIGTSTETSMKSGVINGIAAEIDGMIDRYEEKNARLITILTGGHSTFFESYTKSKIFALPNLVLHGLNTILRYNAD